MTPILKEEKAESGVSRHHFTSPRVIVGSPSKAHGQEALDGYFLTLIRSVVPGRKLLFDFMHMPFLQWSTDTASSHCPELKQDNPIGAL